MSKKLTYHYVNKMVKQSSSKLIESNKTYQDIFNIMFSYKDNEYLEYVNNGKHTTLSYRQVESLIKRESRYLATRLKDSKSKYVGLKLDNCPEWITAFWSILMAGYIPVLINTRTDDNYNQILLDSLKVEYVISDHPFYEFHFINAYKAPYEETKGIDNESWANEIVLATCGSRGVPKLCFYNGDNISNQILLVKDIIPMDKDLQSIYKGKHKQLAFLPFYHIFGLVAVLLWFSFFHQIIVFPVSLSPTSLQDTCKRFEVTSFSAVPLVWNLTYQSLIKEVNNQGEKTVKKFNKGIDLSLKIQSAFPKFGKWLARSILFKGVRAQMFGPSVKFLISGGGYISKEIIRVLNGLGYTTINGYGLTECGIICLERSQKVNQIILGSIGKPLLGVDFKIQDNQLHIKSNTRAYKLIIDGKEFISNYEEYYATSDRANIDNNGNYYIEGRMDEVVSLPSGELISLVEEENSFIFSTDISLAIFLIENKLNLFLYFENINNIKKRNDYLSKIFKINANLPSFKRMSHIFLASNPLPMVMKGNVAKNLLFKEITANPDLFIEVNQSTITSKEVSSNDDEFKACVQKIKVIFGTVLKIDPSTIKDEDNFISSLNGDSLSYFLVCDLISKEFNVEINIGDGVIFYTCEDFAKYVLGR